MSGEDVEIDDLESLRDRVENWKLGQEAWLAVERKGQGMLTLIDAAEIAMEEGNPERAAQLVSMVEEDLGEDASENWEEDEDPEGLEDEELEAEAAPVEDTAPSKAKFQDLRDLALLTINNACSFRICLAYYRIVSIIFPDNPCAFGRPGLPVKFRLFR